MVAIAVEHVTSALPTTRRNGGNSALVARGRWMPERGTIPRQRHLDRCLVKGSGSMVRDLAESLERYRSYLRVLIDLQVSPHLRPKIDPSGIIQQTMLEAHQARPNFEETSDDLLPWLRRILANNLADEIRKLQTIKRGGGRELSLEQSLDHSSLMLERFVAKDQASASHRMTQQEEVLKLTTAMARLPQTQRDALILQHWHGFKLAEVAEKMGKSRVAVAGLIKRAIQTLREQLTEPD